MNIEHELKVIWLAMSPLLELRGAIPYGVIRHNINPYTTLLLAVLGSTIIIPIVYYLFLPCMDFLERIPKIGPSFQKYRNKIIQKSKKLGKIEFIGLMIFVGIPLPGTGAWTGSMVASVLKMPFLLSFISIFLGNVIAGIIMILLSHGSVKLLSSL